MGGFRCKKTEKENNGIQRSAAKTGTGWLRGDDLFVANEVTEEPRNGMDQKGMGRKRKKAMMEKGGGKTEHQNGSEKLHRMKTAAKKGGQGGRPTSEKVQKAENETSPRKVT